MELRLIKHYDVSDPNSWRCEDGLGYFYMLKLQSNEVISRQDGIIKMWFDVPIVEEV
jgi:hypothetical protein